MSIPTDKGLRIFRLVLLFACILMMLAPLLFMDRLLLYTADSSANLTMNVTREVVYPTFLLLMRTLFGENGFLVPTLVFQSVFAGFSIWMLCSYLQDAFQLPNWLTAMLAFGVSATLYLMGRTLFYIDSIQTEALAIPFCFLILRFTARAILEKRFLPLLGASVFTVLGILTRGQFMLFLVVTVFAALYVAFARNVFRRAILPIVLCTAAIALFTGHATRVYHYYANGVYASTPFSKKHIATRMLYVADPEDAALFSDDPELQRIFLLAEEEMIELKRDYASVSDRPLFAQYAHLEGQFDYILFYTLQPTIVTEMIPDFFPEESAADWILLNDTAGKLILPLLKDNFPKYARTVWNACIVAAVRANSFHSLRLSSKFNALAAGWSVLMYALACVLMIRAYIRKNPAAYFMTLVLITILGFIAVPALSLFPSSRYMIYVIGPFYAALTILIYGEIRHIREKKRNPGA